MIRLYAYSTLALIHVYSADRGMLPVQCAHKTERNGVQEGGKGRVLLKRIKVTSCVTYPGSPSARGRWRLNATNPPMPGTLGMHGALPCASKHPPCRASPHGASSLATGGSEGAHSRVQDTGSAPGQNPTYGRHYSATMDECTQCATIPINK